MVKTIKEMLQYLDICAIDYKFEGDRDKCIQGFSSLGNYVSNTLTWVKNEKNARCFSMTIPSLAVVQEGIVFEAENKIITRESKRAFFKLVEWLAMENVTPKPQVGSGTYIAPNVKMGTNVKIGYNCVLDGDITIGDGTVIANNVVIVNQVTIGKSCCIQSQVVIGEDGFAWINHEDGSREMIKHFGAVHIGDNVFIGSHTNIARAEIDATVIGNGVKIAPSTHIGHNVRVENDSIIICSRLYGSVHVGDHAYITSSTIKNQSNIGRNTVIGMDSTIIFDAEENSVYIGTPAKKLRGITERDRM